MDSETTLWKISQAQLSDLLRDPGTARKDPYLLFIAHYWEKVREYMYDLELSECDGDDEPDYDGFKADGLTIDKSMLETILESCMDDVASAQENGLVIRIDGKPFRLSKTVTAKREVMSMMADKFCEEHLHECSVCVIDRNRIMTPYDPERKLKDTASELKRSRQFFHKITWLVEATDYGWDELTDMEAAAYIWGIRMARYDGMMAKTVMKEALKTVSAVIRDVAELTIEDLSSCWNKEFGESEVSADSQFSMTKILEWNKANRQESIVDDTDTDTAEDFWYEKGRRIVYGEDV